MKRVSKPIIRVISFATLSGDSAIFSTHRRETARDRNVDQRSDWSASSRTKRAQAKQPYLKSTSCALSERRGVRVDRC